jgi:hypothetical protein
MQTFIARVSRIMLIAVASFAPISVFAAEESIGAKSQRLAVEANGIMALILTAAQVVGIVFLWGGISKIRKDKEQPGQGLMGQGMMGCAIGVFLYFLPRLMGVGEATFLP